MSISGVGVGVVDCVFVVMMGGSIGFSTGVVTIGVKLGVKLGVVVFAGCKSAQR